MEKSKVITGHLNKILKEKDVEIIVKGKKKLITKGEALARQMVASALGYTETIDVLDTDGNVTGTREAIHPPDRVLVKEIADRVEGKAATTGLKEEDHRPTIADEVTELGKKHLNAIAKKSSLKI